MKRYSIGLLLAGMGLIIGSCVPVAQTVWSSAGSAPIKRLALSPGGDRGMTLEVDESLTSVPVVLIQPYAGAADADPATLNYSFSIADASGRALISEDGTASFDSPAREGELGPGTVKLTFHEITIPGGEWIARLDTHSAAGLIRGAELRLVPPPPGVFPALLTTLVLAILGWLAASLGAVQWVRAEAANPARVPDGDPAARVRQERVWTVGCHLSALLGYIVPFGHLLGPLAIWLTKRHGLPAVERAGRDVLNFQLSITLYVLAGLLLSFFLIGLAVLFLVVIFHFSMALHASLRAQRGIEARYPLSIRFIRPGQA